MLQVMAAIRVVLQLRCRGLSCCETRVPARLENAACEGREADKERARATEDTTERGTDAEQARREGASPGRGGASSYYMLGAAGARHGHGSVAQVMSCVEAWRLQQSPATSPRPSSAGHCASNSGGRLDGEVVSGARGREASPAPLQPTQGVPCGLLPKLAC
jgi:hypothetical protein